MAQAMNPDARWVEKDAHWEFPSVGVSVYRRENGIYASVDLVQAFAEDGRLALHELSQKLTDLAWQIDRLSRRDYVPEDRAE